MRGLRRDASAITVDPWNNEGLWPLGDGLTLNELPPEVAALRERLRTLLIPAVVNRNAPADPNSSENNDTCRAIARRRTPAFPTSAAGEGIPVQAELKSELCLVTREDGTYLPVLVHVRGNELVDREKVARALDADRCERADDELTEWLGLRFGQINPFSGIPCQVFDSDVMRRCSLHDTVMTNAGHPDWSVEFDPNRAGFSLNRQSSHVKVADVARAGPSPTLAAVDRAFDNVLGLLTGNSLGTGLLTIDAVNRAFAARLASMSLRLDSTNPAKVKDLPLQSQGDLTTPRIYASFDGRCGLSMDLGRFRPDVLRGDLSALDAWSVTPHLSSLDSRVTVVGVPCHTRGPAFDDIYRRECASRGPSLRLHCRCLS
ncbi:hypothetical protein CO046_02495 [Candidatus Peregrinibacteria bacterium CG_4_9_14_0_2_um_filter_53_11]|nr:MAG: hypothetical protein CO046_02495 [Candidatus Peregrinibacteria bacterium CG_4_9_14_0_2_um_filter_53_11]